MPRRRASRCPPKNRRPSRARSSPKRRPRPTTDDTAAPEPEAAAPATDDTAAPEPEAADGATAPEPEPETAAPATDGAPEPTPAVPEPAPLAYSPTFTTEPIDPAPAWAPPAEPASESLFQSRPELAVGAAFAGGLVLALILKRLAR